MITINTSEIDKPSRDALAFRFYQAVKASTEDPKKKQQIIDRMQKEELCDRKKVNGRAKVLDYIGVGY